MKNINVVNIHGKEYTPVAGRVQMAHQSAMKQLSILTEVLSHAPVLVKATVITDKGTFNGISAANPNKTIEKQSPYEVAETSAVGRALGFAGFGSVDSIATADEMIKAGAVTGSARADTSDPTDAWPKMPNGKAAPVSQDKPSETGQPAANNHFCHLHQAHMKERTSARGHHYHDHRSQGHLINGNVIPDPKGDWYWCGGKGYHLSLTSIS
jgi:hypothetical protein